MIGARRRLMIAFTNQRGGPLRSPSPNKIAAAGGIAYVALLTIGDDLIAKGEGPELDAPPAKIAHFVADHYDTTQFLIGRGVGLVGVAMLALFFIALRQRLRDADPESGVLPELVLAGGAFASVAQSRRRSPLRHMSRARSCSSPAGTART
jgi:hypothetical protein